MFKKALAVMLAAVMLLAVTPVPTLAERSVERADRERAYRRMDQAWAELETAEAVMISKKATPAQTVRAAYEAALKSDRITDVVWQDENGFTFLVDGMANAYDYRIRCAAQSENAADNVVRSIVETTSEDSVGSNVLLVGPCYSTDPVFTDYYQGEAASVNGVTGGTLTMLLNADATATNIMNALPNNGIVIFDSHGASYYETSYLCLMSSTGIEAEDFINQWALNFGSGTYGIDGRFIANHAGGNLPNSLVWLATAESMMTPVFAQQLRNIGAGVVYGYSQKFDFSGERQFAEVFWREMMAGAAVASAIETMKNEKGCWDPAYSDYTFENALSGSVAFPVVVSDADPYPADPDNYQTVNSTWKLIGSATANPTPAPSTCSFVKADSIEAGEDYLITYTYSGGFYVLTTTLYDSSRLRYPCFTDAVLTENGPGYDIAISGTAYGSDADAFLYTAGGNASSGWTFSNTAAGYLAFDASGYPTFASEGLIEWTYSGGSLRNTDYSVDSFVYGGFSTAGKYFKYSKTAVNFTFYKRVEQGSVPVTPIPTIAPTATPVPAPTEAPGSYEFVQVSSIEAGERYLIGYNDNGTPYILTTTLRDLTKQRNPRFAQATVTTNGTACDIDLVNTAYGSDVTAFLYTAGGNASSGWTFNNPSVGYLAFNASGYPVFASEGLIEWTYSDGTLRNTDYTYDSYVYAGFNNSAYKCLTYSNTGVVFNFYKLIAAGSATPTPSPTPTPTPVPTTAFAIDDNATGGYTGDYVVIYNPGTSTTSGVSTGSLSGLIDTTVSTTGGMTVDERNAFIREKTDADRPYIIDVDSEFGFIDINSLKDNPTKATYNVGTTKSFSIYNYSPGGSSITFKVLYVGDHCRIWTPTVSNYYPLDGIDTSFAQTVAEEFDANFARMTSSFGNFRDSNGDGKVNLMFYNIDDGWTPGNGYTAGYFWASDFSYNGLPMLHIDTYPGVKWETTSGETRVDIEGCYGTFMHEFQHLINYSVTGGMDSWLNEGFSGATEEMFYPGSGLFGRIRSWTDMTFSEDMVGNFPSEHEYNSSYALHKGTSIYTWDKERGDIYCQYAISMLLSQYLYTRTGGTTVYQTIMNYVANGYAEVSALAKGMGTTNAALAKDFFTCMVANDLENGYGFMMQPGYDPAEYYGIEDMYDMLAPVVFTGSSSTIYGGGFIVVKPKNGVYNPPSNASSTLKYVGITLERANANASYEPSPTRGGEFTYR